MSDEFSIRQATVSDLPEIRRIQLAAWGEEGAATEEKYRSRIETFPIGVIVAEPRNGSGLAAVASSCVLKGYDLDNPIPTWAKATDDGLIRGVHDPGGDVLYGVDIASDPTIETMAAAGSLVIAGMETVVRLGLRYGVIGSRIPDYHKHASEIPLEEYVRTRVIKNKGRFADVTREMREIKERIGWTYLDHELNWFTFRFFRDRTFYVHRAIPGYFPDPESCDNAALIVWENPDKVSRN